jgi:hypothetical protein
MPLLAALTFAATCWAFQLPLALGGVGAVLSAGTVATIDRLTAVWRERRRHSSEADSWLRTSTGNAVPPRYAGRAEKLCSVGERRGLAKALRNHIAAAQSARLHVSFIVDNRVGIRENSRLMESVAATLDDLDQPITPAGVLLIRQLLTDATSPLYWRRRTPDLTTALTSVGSVLEPH